MDKIEDTKLFAIQKHGNQFYGNELYIVHLEEVYNVLKRFNFNDEKYLCSAYLHDTIEDTRTTYVELKKEFGIEIVEIVYCVTDELGRNREERKTKTYPKILSNEDTVIVKIADTIANVEHCIKDKNKKLLKMYIDEHNKYLFWKWVGNFPKSKKMFIHLNRLIDENG